MLKEMSILMQGERTPAQLLNVFSKFNPPSRTQRDQSLIELVDGMKRFGFWEFQPIVLGRDGGISDGHRRVMAASEAAIEKVPVVQVNQDTDILFILINSTRKPLSSRDMSYFAAITKDTDLVTQYGSKTLRLHLDKIMEWGGAGLLEKIVDSGKSVQTISEWSSRVARYTGHNDRTAMMMIACWIINHNATMLIRQFMTGQQDPKELWAAIESNSGVLKFTAK